ncbi:MAG: flippase [Chloroflexota bacterium]
MSRKPSPSGQPLSNQHSAPFENDRSIAESGQESFDASSTDGKQVRTVRTVVRNSGYTALSDLLDRVANIFIIVYLSRNLGAGSVGIYTLAVSYFFIGSRFAFWGLDHLLIRDTAKQSGDVGKYVVNFVFLRALLSLAVIGIISGFVWVIPYGADVRLVILIFLWGILSENIINIAEAVFIAVERMEFLSLVALFSGLVKLISCFIVIGMGGGVSHVAIALLVSGILSLFLSLWLLRPFIGAASLAIDLGFCKEQLIVGRPFFVVAVTYILNSRLDTILLSLFISKEEIGFYGAAVTVVTALTMIPQGIGTALFPIFARVGQRKESESRFSSGVGRRQANATEGEPQTDVQPASQDGLLSEKYRQIFKYMIIVALPLSLGLLAVADGTVRLVFTSAFVETAPVLRILALFIIFNGLNVLNSRMLIVANRQDLIARFQALTLGINVVLIVLLVPSFGIVGAAMAKVLTIAILYLLLRRAVFTSVLSFSILDLMRKPMLAGLGMFGVVLLLHSGGLWVQIGVGGLIYVMLILSLGIVTPEERGLWRSVLKL